MEGIFRKSPKTERKKKSVLRILVFNFCLFVAHYFSNFLYKQKPVLLLVQTVIREESHGTDIKYAWSFGDTYIFIKWGEFEFLHQKELHSSACHALLSWVFTAEVVKLLHLKERGVCCAKNPSEAAGINKPLLCFHRCLVMRLRFWNLKVFEIATSVKFA